MIELVDQYTISSKTLLFHDDHHHHHHFQTHLLFFIYHLQSTYSPHKIKIKIKNQSIHPFLNIFKPKH